MDPSPAPAIRPPVFIGCSALVAAVVFVVAAIVFTLVYLNSGADSGTVVLNLASDYPGGSEQYISAHNFYIVRLADGTFVALSDLDAANRATPAHRCRIQPVGASDPSLRGILARFGSRMSAPALGSTLVFREACNGAIYDITGARIDRNAPNLDRYPTSINSAGRLTVDIAARTCSERTATVTFQPVTCP